MLKSMTWAEFVSWMEYDTAYPHQWEFAQFFGSMQAQNASSNKKSYKADDIYPWLKNIGNAKQKHTDVVDSINEDGQVAVSHGVLALLNK